MESSERRAPSSGEAMSRTERLRNIIEFLERSAAAHDASEAHILVQQAFDAIERPVVAHPNIDYPMIVNPFLQMMEVDHEGRIVHFDSYAKHMLFLGDNGSIEIRSKERYSDKKQGHPYENLELVFSKAGADGRGMWERARS